MSELIFILLAGGIACALVLRRLGCPQSSAWIIGLSAGPVLIALLPVELDFLLPPSLTRSVLIITCGVIGFWPRSNTTAAVPPSKSEPEIPTSIPLMILAAVSIAVFLVMPWITPIMAHDATEYGLLAVRLAEQGGTAPYPVTPADPVTGFFFPSSHPRGYAALVATGIDPAVALPDIPMRVVTTWYSILYLASVTLLVPAGVSRTLAVIFGSSAPFFLIQAMDLSIDPIRISLTASAMLGVLQLLRNPTLGLAVSCGIASGGLASVHSSSIASIALLTLSIILLSPESLSRRVRVTTIVIGTTCLLGGWQYLANLLERGSPVSDLVKVWEIDSLGEQVDLRIRRKLHSPWERFAKVVQLFTDIRFFGLLWIAAIPGVFRSFARGATPAARLSMVFLLGFLAVMVITGIAGIDLVIKNPRYPMTTMPAAAVLAAIGVSAFPIPWRVWVSGLMATSTVAAILLALVGRMEMTSVTDPSSNDWLARGTSRDLSLSFARDLTRDEPFKTIVTSQGPWGRWVGSGMISHIDDRLIPTYLGETPEESRDLLKGLGVRNIFYSNYFPACWTNSPMLEIMMSPEWTRAASLETPVTSLMLELLESPRPVEYIAIDSDRLKIAREIDGFLSQLRRVRGQPLKRSLPDPDRLGYRVKIEFRLPGLYRFYVTEPWDQRYVWDGVCAEAPEEITVFLRTQFSIDSIELQYEAPYGTNPIRVTEVEEARLVSRPRRPPAAPGE